MWRSRAGVLCRTEGGGAERERIRTAHGMQAGVAQASRRGMPNIWPETGWTRTRASSGYLRGSRRHAAGMPAPDSKRIAPACHPNDKRHGRQPV